MNRLLTKKLFIGAILTFLLSCCSLSAYALTDTGQFTVYCEGKALTSEGAEVEVGQASLFEVKENSGNTADYAYVWLGAGNDQDGVVVENADENDSSKALATAVSSLYGISKTMEIKVCISGTDGFEKTVEIPVKIRDYRVEVGLNNRDRPDVKLQNSEILQSNLTADAYKVEYRVFQAICNLGKSYSFVLDTLPSPVTYVFDGSDIQPIETSDYGKTLNFEISVAPPDRSVRNGLVSAAASFGVTSFDFQNGDYYLLDMSAAGEYPGKATVQMNFDDLYQTQGNEIESKIAEGKMKLYIYDEQTRSLKEGPELEQAESDSGIAEFVAEKGEMYVLTEKISLIGNGSSSETGSELTGNEPIPSTSDRIFPFGLAAIVSFFCASFLKKNYIKK